MTLDAMLRKKIADLPTTAERDTLTVPHGPGTLSLTLERGDAIGCLLWDLRLQFDTPLAGTQADWAARVASRVTGLLEALKVHEIDPARNQAILRSAAPTAREQVVHYYEVVLHGMTMAHLCRYQGHRESQPRNQVAFALTYEALAKLVEDLSAAK